MTRCKTYFQLTKNLIYIQDNLLSQTPEGREVIKLYYELSPVIVKAIENDEDFKGKVREVIDGALELITGIVLHPLI